MAESNTAPRVDQQNQSVSVPDFVKPTSPRKAGLSASTTSTRPRDTDNDDRPLKKPRLETPTLTATAAFAEKRAVKQQPHLGEVGEEPRTSPNPAFEVVQALSAGPQNAMSQLTSASTSSSKPNPATSLSEPMAAIADAIQPPAAFDTSAVSEGQVLTSPTSLSSGGTLDTAALPSIPTTAAGSPQLADESFRQVTGTTESGSTSPAEAPKAFSYPAPLLQPPLSDPTSRRGNSLPHSTTRQEKPYVCATCSSRFRRLHDLKRHTKLHTGERPHICPRCKRKFARGDALARHNKGPGGCANRRASLDEYGDDTFDGADESMDGVVYHEPEAMDDEEGNDRRPGIRKHAPSGDDHGSDDHEHHSRIPSTYPPISGRPSGGITGNMFQPRAGFSGSGSGSSSGLGAPVAPAPPLPYPSAASLQSNARAPTGGSIYAQNPITESPKPLSPSQPHSRAPSTIDGSLSSHRSPSLVQYHTQQPSPAHARSGSGPTAPLGMSPGAPQLPPPHTLHPPPDARYSLQSQIGPTHPPTQPSGPPTHMGSGPLSGSSHSNSHSSHGQSGHGSMEGAPSMFAKDDRIWAYVKSLEQRMNSMAEENKSLEQKVNTMQEDINSLRSRLAAAAQNPPARLV